MTILLIRANGNEIDAAALADVGVKSHSEPYLQISQFDNPSGVKRMAQALSSKPAPWLIATSTNAIRYFAAQVGEAQLKSVIGANPDLKFAAIGRETENSLRALGAETVLVGADANSQSLADRLVNTEPTRAVIPAGSLAMKNLPQSLSQAGFSVISEVVYQTELSAQTPASAARLRDGTYSGVLLRSPSAARALAHFAAGIEVAIFCAGETTAEQARNLGFRVIAVASDPTPETVAKTIASSLKELNLDS